MNSYSYQADTVAQQYSTLGYLVAITSVLGMAILPRGVFIQTMLLNILSICIAAAVNLLALYCAVQARIHTTPTGVPPIGYVDPYSENRSHILFIQPCIPGILSFLFAHPSHRAALKDACADAPITF